MGREGLLGLLSLISVVPALQGLSDLEPRPGDLSLEICCTITSEVALGDSEELGLTGRFRGREEHGVTEFAFTSKNEVGHILLSVPAYAVKTCDSRLLLRHPEC